MGIAQSARGCEDDHTPVAVIIVTDNQGKIVK